jgi:dTDP-4-dehydrorhamnose reductase
MRLLVTGAGGMLGQAVVAAAHDRDHEVVALGHAQLDIADADAVRHTIEGAAPDAVINCAAWTDVDGAEAHRGEALAVNGEGAGNVARAALEADAQLVHISTDYVFAGDATRPYVESDEIDPQSEYGRTKAAGEQAVAESSPAHAIVRSAWLFGLGGRNFVETMLALGAQRGEIRVVTDQRGCPTFTGHLAPALLDIAQRRSAGIYHVAGSGNATWNEFAIEIFGRAGVECRVSPTTTEEFPRPARRPAYSVLGSERADAIALPSWRDGLEAYLRARAGVGQAQETRA